MYFKVFRDPVCLQNLFFLSFQYALLLFLFDLEKILLY